MKCPNCKKDVVIPNHAYLNLETYKVGGSVLVASECCNTGFTVKMNISYTHTEYKGKETEDAWGVKLFKKELEVVEMTKEDFEVLLKMYLEFRQKDKSLATQYAEEHKNHFCKVPCTIEFEVSTSAPYKGINKHLKDLVGGSLVSTGIMPAEISICNLMAIDIAVNHTEEANIPYLDSIKFKQVKV